MDYHRGENMKKYKVASLFAGIGGICRGFENAGAELVWANEIDPYACATYKENFKHTLVESDIHIIDTKDVPDFDILTAGFPCQAFSIAGYRKGFNDERGNLFFETLRFIIDKQPKAFLLENVKNLVGHDKGKTFKIMISALEQNGYYVRYAVLNSMEYGNVPQNRERIYVVGFKEEGASERFEFPEKLNLSKRVHDIVDINIKKEKKYYYTEDSQYYPMLKEEMTNKDSIYQLRRIYVRENKSSVCPTLTANMGTGGHNVPLIIDNYGIRKLTPLECFIFQGFGDIKIPEKMSNGRLYKQAGNSVTVPVVERIAKAILEALESII